MSYMRVARKKLSYPLYGADFDPLNHDFLIVGGGGGTTSSGVPNKITLIDASRRNELSEVLELDLSKNEDSVVSLAVASSNSDSLTAYAGINSSQADQEAGKNEHFRSFKIGLPPRKRPAADTEKQDAVPIPSKPLQSQALGRTAFFRSAQGPKSETYQRVLRVAPAHTEQGERIAAVASGLAAQNEVITFRVTPTPGSSDVISRINVESGEAADLDIFAIEHESKSHVLAYCTDYDVYLQHIPRGGKQVAEPIKAYSIPSGPNRKTIRSLRWLNSRYFAILRNFPRGGGADVEILKTDKDYNQAIPTLVKRLCSTTKKAVGLAVCSLSQAPSGSRQFVLAIAGQDSSIEILTTDYDSASGMQKLKRYQQMLEVHDGPTTRITFSTFQPPSLPVSKTTMPQSVRLASVGVDQVVVVHTLPLRPYPATSKTPRYVLVPPSEILQNTFNVTIALLVVGVVGFIMQIFCEVRGLIPPVLGVRSWFSPEWQERLSKSYGFSHLRASGPVIPESMPPVVTAASTSILSATEALKSAGEAATSIATDATETATNLLSSLLNSAESDDKVIVIRDDAANSANSNNAGNPGADANTAPLLTELHDDTVDTLKSLKKETVKKWDDLTEKEKKGWKRKLIDAGHWTEQEGEKILKGIFFSELAGVVGAALHG